MLFQSKIRETPLTQAVLSDDISTLQQLGKFRDQVMAENELGYNALELAQYLGKKECIKWLRSTSFRKMKVIPADSGLQVMDEADFEKFFGVKYTSCFIFADYILFQRVLKSCSWVLKTDLFAEDVIDLGRKYHEGLFVDKFADTSIRWINDVLGYGLFAEEDMQPDTFIGEYSGVIRQVKRFQEQANAYCVNYPKMVWGLNQFTIDALDQGNEARFINHSYRPNLTLKMAVDRNLIHPLFFTNQFISKGTQLSFDYGKSYWRNRGEPLDFS